MQKETANRLQRLTLHSTCHVNQNQKTRPKHWTFVNPDTRGSATGSLSNNVRQRPDPSIEHSGQSTPRRWKIRRTHRMEWQLESGSEILENRYDSYQSRCQLIITTVESLVQLYASGGQFDQLSETRRTCGLEI
jgi:hypothetical protein